MSNNAWQALMTTRSEGTTAGFVGRLHRAPFSGFGLMAISLRRGQTEIMPAKSKKQQMAAGAALAVKRGDAKNRP